MIFGRIGILSLVAALAFTGLGCGDGLPSERRLIAMIEDAAKTTESDIESSDKLGFWSEVESQTLTLVFAGTRPSATHCGERALITADEPTDVLSSSTHGWTVFDLQRCLAAPKAGLSAGFFDAISGGSEDPSVGEASVVWAEFVANIEISANGDVAGGVVEFDRPGCFNGTVPFSLLKVDGEWRVDSFDLLDAGWKVQRGDDERWVARRVAEVPELPDLRHKSEYLQIWLQSVWGGALEVDLNRERVLLGELADLVAGEIVILRSEREVSGEQFDSVIAELRRADPPVLSIFTTSSRMIDNCWNLLGFGENAPTPVEKLLDDHTLASPMDEVPRAMLPRRAVSLCVGATGISVNRPDGLRISPSESVRYKVEEVIAAVEREPHTPVVMLVQPDARFADIDIALDIAVRSGTNEIFVHTGPEHGIVFEIGEKKRPTPLPLTTRSKPASSKPAKAKRVAPKVVSSSNPSPREPYRFVVNGPVTEPLKIDGPDAIYPDAAKRAWIQGVVVLEAVIGTDGRVEGLKTLRGLPLGLTEAAIQAVEKWRFEPATLRGEPVPVKYIITVRFTLQ